MFTKNTDRYVNVAQTTYSKNNDPNDDKLWHERLGHIHGLKFLRMKRNNLHDDNHVLRKINPMNDLCEACVYAKQARLPFSKKRDRSHVNRPLFAVHTDVCGPITPPTIDDKNYFVTFIDEYTHYTVENEVTVD